MFWWKSLAGLGLAVVTQEKFGKGKAKKERCCIWVVGAVVHSGSIVNIQSGFVILTA